MVGKPITAEDDLALKRLIIDAVDDYCTNSIVPLATTKMIENKVFICFAGKDFEVVLKEVPPDEAA